VIPLWSLILTAVFAFAAGFLACLLGIANGQRQKGRPK